MTIDDNYIKKYFTTHGVSARSERFLSRTSERLEIFKYLKNRFTDTNNDTSISEIIYRIFNNIEIVPKCVICGKPVRYLHGVYSEYCSKTCMKSKESNLLQYEKRKQKMLEHFGVENNFQRECVKNQIKLTNIEKYGVENVGSSEFIKERIKQTCLERYGVEYSSQNELVKNKFKQTCLERYGVSTVLQIKSIHDKANNLDAQIKRSKTLIGKHKQCSKIEKQIMEYLNSRIGKESYVYNYLDKDRYPFKCDFYIYDLDLFIEINAHWTHGNKPYEGTCNDIKILNFWKSQNTKFYNNAIYTWTVRDVKKKNIAKQHNLNYLAIYSNDFNVCIGLIDNELNKLPLISKV